MKISILKYTPDSIYYNVKPAKLAPNALKTAKKCELPNSKLGTVSIKILKNHKVYHRKSENIQYNTHADYLYLVYLEFVIKLVIVYKNRQKNRIILDEMIKLG